MLHEAVRLAGIAKTGPILPLFGELDDTERDLVRQATARLLEFEANLQEPTP